MKRIDFILNQARKQTENEEFSDTTGIGDDEIIQYINDAQYRLLSKITATHPTVFVKEGDLIQTQTNVESYDLPDDILLENRVTSVEYSDTGEIDDFIRLRPLTMVERARGETGFPEGYIRRSGKVLLSPIPSDSTGFLRVNYVRRIAELDKRRGRVLSVTLDSGSNQITALTLDVTDGTFDSDELNNQDFITVVDKKGNQKMIAVEIDSVDANTGVVTISSGFTYQSGETIEVGNYVLRGEDSSTHSELPKICERYLVAYVAFKLLKRDSSEDAFEQLNELTSIENDIVDAFSDVSDDVMDIPIIDGDY